MISRRAVVFSIALHALIVLLFTVGAGFTPERVRHVAPGKRIVEARVVDNQAVARELEKLKAAEQREQREAERRAEELARKAAAEEKRLERLKAEQEQVKRAEETARRKQAEAEKRARDAKAREEEAARRKAEAERERQAAEERRLAEEAAARQREADAREAERKRREKALQDEIAAEEAARVAAAQARADRAEIDRYVAAIAARVRQSFTILPGLDGLSCTLRIRLIPGGEVAAVEIVKSSGNPTFDRQAETAVRKASPLPVPTEPRLFQQMRSISFVFDPRS